MLTFLPLYLSISLIPIIFLFIAWRSKRQQFKSHEQSETVPQSSEIPRRGKRTTLSCPRCTEGVWTQGIRTLKGGILANHRLGSKVNEYEDIEMQDLSAGSSGRKKRDAISPIITVREIHLPTKPLPTKTRPGCSIPSVDARDQHEVSRALERIRRDPLIYHRQRRQQRRPCRIRVRKQDGSCWNHDYYGLTIYTPAKTTWGTTSSSIVPWWKRPDKGGDSIPQSESVPLFRLNGSASSRSATVLGPRSIFRSELRGKFKVIATGGDGAGAGAVAGQ